MLSKYLGCQLYSGGVPAATGGAAATVGLPDLDLLPTTLERLRHTKDNALRQEAALRPMISYSNDGYNGGDDGKTHMQWRELISSEAVRSSHVCTRPDVHH